MSFFIYKIVLKLFKFFHWVLSFVNPEIRQLYNLKLSPSNEIIHWRSQNSQNKLIIIHCASLGEFEMALPVFESLQNKLDSDFLFTFFSASGYNYAKIPKSARKSYLPFDNLKEIENFLNLINPDLFVFVKYEYWFNLLNRLDELNIPYGFINVLNQKLPTIFNFKFTRNLVNKSSFYTVTNQKTKEIFESIFDIKILIFNDLRYVKGVIDSKNTDSSKYQILKKHGYKNVIVCGSIYPADFEIIENSITSNPETLWLIAPHKINTPFDARIKSKFPNCINLSSILSNQTFTLNSNVVLIDTIGDLKYIYSFGTLAYIGGGFDKGIHNVIEPISYNIPVIVGPKFDAFPEVIKLISDGKIFAIVNVLDFERKFCNIQEEQSIDKMNINLNESHQLNNLEKLTSYIIRNEI